jgi:hypothetical protein
MVEVLEVGMEEKKPPEDKYQSEHAELVEENAANDVSGIPAVQQEALQELARQIVREAGLQAGDQQELAEQREREERAARYSGIHETMREWWHLQMEIPKHAAAASGVLL